MRKKRQIRKGNGGGGLSVRGAKKKRRPSNFGGERNVAKGARIFQRKKNARRSGQGGKGGGQF